ncbi:MAG: tRNA (adenosine(37)-N6)-threonylcarbamoyltransferase complex dimerization subunit type 1 TsaB [Planctomycetes bacterium]|nr:tRNA (adenosine(37)-N6)-threonylcarbamoyltransferase complex dimerization subunit type 1 TsaB [Planctomycetota bacterium]
MPDGTRNNLLSLSLETSGRLGSIALSRGPRVVEAVTFSADQRHAVELFPTLQAVCRRQGVPPASIEEIYVSAGPGSFTGLRIGLTTARTWAWAGGVRVVRVPTLEVVAQNALEMPTPPDDLVVLLDAKRGHVFAAAFRLASNHYEAVTEAAEWDVQALAATVPAGCAALGEGIAYHRAAVDRAGLTVGPEELNRPRAEVVHRIGYTRAGAGAGTGAFDDLTALVPIYVRRPEAEEVWERRHGPDG